MAAQKAGEIARSQFWAISRRQLLEAGFSPARIRSWLAAGRLHLRYPGVYVWGRPELCEKGEHAAALLFSSSAGGSGLTGLSGLWWQGLLGSRPDVIHIDAPGRVPLARGPSHPPPAQDRAP